MSEQNEAFEAFVRARSAALLRTAYLLTGDEFDPPRALPAEAPPISAPFRLPAQAVICRCNTVTKRQLVAAWQAGARDVDAMATATRATTGCGGCRDAVTGIREWLASTDPTSDAHSLDLAVAALS